MFSIFAWAFASRSFKPWHFLVGIGSFADYYYSAGLAKWSFGPPHSWLNENLVSNISVAGYVRGWASWVPEETFLRFAELARKADPVFLHYTMVIACGAVRVLPAPEAHALDLPRLLPAELRHLHDDRHLLLEVDDRRSARSSG